MVLCGQNTVWYWQGGGHSTIMMEKNREEERNDGNSCANGMMHTAKASPEGRERERENKDQPFLYHYYK